MQQNPNFEEFDKGRGNYEMSGFFKRGIKTIIMSGKKKDVYAMVSGV